MKKTVVIILVILMIFSVCTVVIADEDTKAKSYILIDANSGTVLREFNADEQRECASVVKSMTLLLLLEANDSGRLSLDDTVNISSSAASKGGTQVFLDANTEHTVENLFKAVIVASANDAAAALAEKLAGSEEEFVLMMNTKAKELGLGANFVNATGISAEGQTMSARDIAVVCSKLVKYDLFFTFSGIWIENYIHPDGRKTEMVNSNQLVRFYEGSDGICTGSSPTAGYCLASTVNRSGGRFIFVSLGSPNSASRFDEAKKAFDYAYAGFTAKTIVRKGQQIGKNVEVIGGTCEYVNIYAADGFSSLIDKGKESTLEKELVLLEEIKAPLKKGDKVGYLSIFLDGTEIARIDVVVDTDVEALDYPNSLKKILTWWLFT